jgi:hypothetical protein
MTLTSNFVKSNPLVTLSGTRELLRCLLDPASSWDQGVAPPMIVIYTNLPVMSPSTVLSDLVLAPITPGAFYPLPLTAGAIPAVSANGTPYAFADGGFGLAVVRAPGDPDFIATGWALLSNDLATLIALQNFSDPLSISDDNSVVFLEGALYVPPWGPLANP